MVKKLLTAVCCLGLIVGLSACQSQEAMSYDDYDLSEYIKVGDYKGLKVAPYKITVTQDEIDDEIETQLEAAATTDELSKDTDIKDGDVVNIDYVGKVDGKEFDGGSAEDYDLTIGSGAFIDGFEDGLIGKHVGDKVKLNLTFPDDYSEEDLQGKDVVFDVTINSGSRDKIPEYNLDFVKNNTDYDNLKDYEASVKDELYDEKEEEAIANQKDTLLSEALDNTEVKEYPEKEVDHYMEFNSDQLDEMADAYDMTREEMLANYGYSDEDAFDAYNEEQSKLWVKQEMFLEYVADKENLEYTDDEKTEMIDEYRDAGYDNDTVYSQTGRTLSDYVIISLLYEKVTDFLLDNAKITGAAEEE